MTHSNADATLFSVLVQPSGRTFDVTAGEAVLAAGIRQGIGLPYGCKDGACGSCKCKLISGGVPARPAPEQSAERGRRGQRPCTDLLRRCRNRIWCWNRAK